MIDETRRETFSRSAIQQVDHRFVQIDELIIVGQSTRTLIDYRARARTRGRYATATGQATQNYRDQTF